MIQYVYFFGGDKTDGHARMRDILGGKGANLAEMSNIGFSVPPGFTISTEVCGYLYANSHRYPNGLAKKVEQAVMLIGDNTGKKFGDPDNPLLVSVRSGGRVSMPGMMDTVLNLGLNDQTVEALGRLSGDRRFALDSYRRFIQMYSDVVLGIDSGDFEEILEIYKQSRDYVLDTELNADDWQSLIVSFKQLVERRRDKPFPQDVNEQLWGAISAVFNSWMSNRAVTYRRLHNIPEDWGTAVTVQAMVFGNMGDDSATGVAFTRNPSNGENELFGEFMINAQGEDVVAGIRTPLDLTKKAQNYSGAADQCLEVLMPEIFNQLKSIGSALEDHYREMQDIEFTIEKGKLWLLQTRTGKRTTKAGLKIAVDLVNEGKITRQEAVMRIDPASLDQLLHPTIDSSADRRILAKGLPASPGAASGSIVFSPDEAEGCRQNGLNTVLVRIETSPEDIHGMHAASAIVTARGGMTSHAAVVARGMGRPCVTGAGAIQIDFGRETLTCAGVTLNKGDKITVDGSTGEILNGEVAMVSPEFSADFATLMGWADSIRRMKVRANAETSIDAELARKFGAEGIGLCRTEHMFFDPARIISIRRMILSDTSKARRRALEHLLAMQRKDFIELFTIMHGLPVTIRLLDPPLHEFLPKNKREIEAVASALDVSVETLLSRIQNLQESNPMLGHRGCRLLITHPEIIEMQIRAILEASCDAALITGEAVKPEIMVPLVCDKREIIVIKEIITKVAGQIKQEGIQLPTYWIGTMIELPRAALKAGEIAAEADFFSFGTNDLTQTTYGISRDDSTGFLSFYLQHAIFKVDPFTTIDQDTVGELIAIAAARGKAAKHGLKLGICGEHGGDPESIRFCEKVGLDYVSCSPFRVPIARLAAAQAAIAHGTTRQSLGSPSTRENEKALPV